jgi:uncharacterized protein YndB with AHSA1/START domain
VEEIDMKWFIRIAAGLVLVLAMAVVLLLIIGHRANAGRVSASTEISASPEQLWAYLNDGEKLKQWVSWLVEVRGWDPQHQGVGTSRTWVMRDENNGGQLMEIQGKCTEYAPPTRLTVLLSAGDIFDGEQAYRLTNLGNGRTRLDVASRYHFTPWFARLMEPLITPAAQKKMVGDLARLKSLVEKNAPGVAAR